MWCKGNGLNHVGRERVLTPSTSQPYLIWVQREIRPLTNPSLVCELMSKMACLLKPKGVTINLNLLDIMPLNVQLQGLGRRKKCRASY
jgi:hypothetical protein